MSKELRDLQDINENSTGSFREHIYLNFRKLPEMRYHQVRGILVQHHNGIFLLFIRLNTHTKSPLFR